MLFHNLLAKTATVAGGAVYTWGYNFNGQLGNNTDFTNKSTPSAVISDKSWTQIVPGQVSTCAIRDDGTLWAWGSNQYGTLGNGDNFVQVFSPQSLTSYFKNKPSWKLISIGADHVAGILSDGTLWTWGYNVYGQLGDSTTVARSSPVQIGTSSWSVVAAGASYTVAITSDGYLYEWGTSTGPVEGTVATSRSSPSFIPYAKRITSKTFGSWSVMCTGTYNAAAIRSDGRLYAWGRNNLGQLGDGTTIDRMHPSYIDNTSSWKAVSISTSHAVAIKADGTLWAWGGNNFAQLGDGTTVNKSSPVQIGTSSWSFVNAGPQHTAAIRADGSLFVWGYGANGQIGNLNNQSYSSPVQIATGGIYQSWAMVSCGASYTTGIQTDGSLWSWGLNVSGQLGDGTTVNKLSPVQVASGGTFQSWAVVAAGVSHTAAVRSDGGLFTWGAGLGGSLGDGTTIGKSSPVQIGTSSWTSVTCGASFTTALKVDGSVWGWGLNTQGQIGDRTAVSKSSPVLVASDINTAVSSTSGALSGSLINNVGKIAIWGYLPYGDGNGFGNITRSQPTAIHLHDYEKVTTFNYVESEGVNAAVIDNNGYLYTWGLNNTGSTGHNFNMLTRVYNLAQVEASAIDYSQPATWTNIEQTSITTAINDVGRLYIWGLNTQGGNGDYSIATRNYPAALQHHSWTKVATGGDHVIAIRADGTLWSWGFGTAGLLGDGTTVSKSSPVQVWVSGFKNSWAAIAAAASSSAAIDVDGKLFTWGLGTNGQTGTGDNLAKSSPVQIGVGSSYTMVTACAQTYAAIRTDGAIQTWGYGIQGQIGNGGFASVSTPTLITSTSSWSFVSGRNAHFAALTIDGQLYTWGANATGQLGDSTTTSKAVATKIGTSSWSAVNVGSAHTLGIDAAGRLFAWGQNTAGALGNNGTSNASSPIQIGTSSWSAISAGADTSYAKTIDNVWYSWGSNTYGALGLGYKHKTAYSYSAWMNVLTPEKMPNMLLETSFKHVTSDGTTTLYTSTNNNVYGAGVNSLYKSIPPYATSTTNVNTLIHCNPNKEYGSWNMLAATASATANFSMGIKTDGTLWGWGFNVQGQVGDGTQVSKSSPVQIGTSSWSAINVGTSTAFGIKADGTLWGWGVSSFGWGDNTTTSRSSPVQIGTDSWAMISSGITGATGIRADGTMWTWGVGTSGRLGDGTTVTKSSMVQIGSGTWRDVSVAALHTLAINNDYKLFAWGDNTYGQLGDGTTVNKSSPVQIGTDSWTIVSTGGVAASFATSGGIKPDGSLWMWGYNQQGQVGDSTTINRSSPVQIGTENSWKILSAGYASAAITTDDYMYTWGNGAQGALGNGATVNVWRPRLINFAKYEKTKWSNVTAGLSYMLGVRKETGELYAWGAATNGQLGDGQASLGKSSPTLVVGEYRDVKVQRAAIGANHTLYLANTGVVWANGGHGAGQLGDGTYEINTSAYRSSPVQIGSGKNDFIDVEASQYASYGLDASGGMWAWGSNLYGELGTGQPPAYNAVNALYIHNVYSKPTQIGTSKSWIAVSTDNYTTYGGANSGIFAITDTGELHTWGTRLNNSGFLPASVLGLNSPVQIGTSSWTAIGGGALHFLGQTVDGKLWSWGWSAQGALADGIYYNTTFYNLASTTNLYNIRTTPQEITGLYDTGYNSWVSINAGGYLSRHQAGIDKDGMLWAWGENGTYQVGDNSTNYKLSPVAIGGGSWTSVAIGLSTTFGIKSDGSLWGWGANPGGKIGDGSTLTKGYPYRIGYESWTAVASGLSHTVGLKADGTVWAWGLGTSGLLGDGTTVSKSSPVQISTFDYGSHYSFKAIACGDSHSLAIRTDGTLWAWGVGTGGRLGDGTTINKSTAVRVTTMGTGSWTAVTAGSDFTAAIDTNGMLYTWGGNTYGQLGINLTVNKSSPVLVGTSSWSMVNAGGLNMMGITVDGALYAWGYNILYQLGDGTSINKSSPVQIGSSSWSFVSSGDVTGFAIRTDGALFAWGMGVNSSLYGITSFIPNSVPTIVASPTRQTGVSAAVIGRGAAYNSFIKGTDNKLYSVGLNFGTGALGSGDVNAGTVFSNYNGVLTAFTIDRPDLTTDMSWSAVSTAMSTAGAIRSDGKLFVWGRNGLSGNYGVLGTGVLSDHNRPTPIDNNSWSAISQGFSHTLAIRADGALFAWGYNAAGQVGNGSTVYVKSPVQIASNGTYESWSVVAAGYSFSHAIRTDGALFAWGGNSSGYLGDNTLVAKSSPVRIGTSSWILVTSAPYNTTSVIHAIRIDGGLFGWGVNTSGAIGDNSVSTRSSPVQISQGGVFSSWTAVSSSGSHTAAITTDGALYCWTNVNTSGLIGDNTIVGKAYPVKIGNNSWIKVAAGPTAYTLAIRSDNLLFGWGTTTGGQLALNDYEPTTTRSSPVQVGRGSWKNISAGANFAIAQAVDNTLWAWGTDNYGVLGLGLYTGGFKSSPVQIASTYTDMGSSITDIRSGQSFVVALGGYDLFAWGYAATNGPYGMSTWQRYRATSANYQLNDIINNSFPSKVGAFSFTAIAVSNNNTYAITSDGAAWAAGEGTGLGTNTTLATPYYRTVYNASMTPGSTSTTSWSQISFGNSHTAAIGADGSLWTWGASTSGELGNSSVSRSSPVQVRSRGRFESWSMVTASVAFTAGIQTDGSLWVWGANNLGQLGDGTTVNKSSPVQIGTSSWAVVTAGANSILAIKVDGTLWGWGTVVSGESTYWGDGTTAPRSSPVQIGTATWTTINKAPFDQATTAGIRTDGTLWTWGFNADGRLGDNTTANKSSMVQIGSDTNWVKVSTGTGHNAAIKTDSTLWTWGFGFGGQLGDGTNVTKSSPVQVSGSWSEVGVGFSHTIGLKTDGTVYTWGSGGSGELGISGLSTTNSPALVAAGGLKVFASTSKRSAYINSTTSNLWVWGSNIAAGLGDLTTVNRSVPVVVAATYYWTEIASQVQGGSGIYGGTLWSWGQNTYGQLGDNTIIARSTPTSIGNMTHIYGGGLHQVGFR